MAVTSTLYPTSTIDTFVAANAVIALNAVSSLDDAIRSHLRSLVLGSAEAAVAARTALNVAEGAVERLSEDRDDANEEADAEMKALFAMVKRQGGTAAQQRLRALWGGGALYELLELDDEAQVQRIDQMITRAREAGMTLPAERTDAVIATNRALGAAARALSAAERTLDAANTADVAARGTFKAGYRRFVKYLTSVHGEDVAWELLPSFTRARRRVAEAEVAPSESSAVSAPSAPPEGDAGSA